MKNSKIEWTHHTFNPWIGCTKVSPACDDCYAARSTPARTLKVAWGPGQPRRRTSEATWREPVKWNAEAERLGVRYRVFCASLADVFDNEVAVHWRRDLFDLINKTPHLDWLLLTKRIGNARSLYAEAYLDSSRQWPSNVWLGATICNQEEADRDIPKLLATPAAKRFLSIEPLLGPVDLPGLVYYGTERSGGIVPLRDKGYTQLDWVIVGGESGPKARPMHPDWARSLRDQCQAAGVPFFFKQWGEWCPWEDRVPLGRDWAIHAFAADGRRVQRAGKATSGRLLDGRAWEEVPA